ncbi:MAG: CDP-alcohol phosphatidyltransferase family protein [Deltaproteobacteria bacterium]|nr:CDP-alcohol phosphatidyltransferase family protein [Deltaproteobacteria bacterium]
MIKAAFGQDFDQVVRRVFPFVARIRVHPDVLTLLGVGVSGLAALAFAFHQDLAGGVVLILAGFFDLIDGVVARIQGVSTRAGAFLDSSMDRVADLLVFAGIAVGMASRPAEAGGADIGGLVLVMAALIGSVMTSYTRARAEAELHESFGVGFVERGERTVVLILGALTGYLVAALWLVAIGSIATTVQRVVVARRLLLEREPPGSQASDALPGAAEAGEWEDVG